MHTYCIHTHALDLEDITWCNTSRRLELFGRSAKALGATTSTTKSNTTPGWPNMVKRAVPKRPLSVFAHRRWNRANFIVFCVSGRRVLRPRGMPACDCSHLVRAANHHTGPWLIRATTSPFYLFIYLFSFRLLFLPLGLLFSRFWTALAKLARVRRAIFCEKPAGRDRFIVPRMLIEFRYDMNKFQIKNLMCEISSNGTEIIGLGRWKKVLNAGHIDLTNAMRRILNVDQSVIGLFFNKLLFSLTSFLYRKLYQYQHYLYLISFYISWILTICQSTTKLNDSSPYI